MIVAPAAFALVIPGGFANIRLNKLLKLVGTIEKYCQRLKAIIIYSLLQQQFVE